MSLGRDLGFKHAYTDLIVQETKQAGPKGARDGAVQRQSGAGQATPTQINDIRTSVTLPATGQAEQVSVRDIAGAVVQRGTDTTTDASPASGRTGEMRTLDRVSMQQVGQHTSFDPAGGMRFAASALPGRRGAVEASDRMHRASATTYTIQVVGERGAGLERSHASNGRETTRGSVMTVDGTFRRMLMASGVLGRDGQVSPAAQRAGMRNDQQAINRMVLVTVTGDHAAANARSAMGSLRGTDGALNAGAFRDLALGDHALAGTAPDGTFRLNGHHYSASDLMAIYEAQVASGSGLAGEIDAMLTAAYAGPDGATLSARMPQAGPATASDGRAGDRALQIAAVIAMAMNHVTTEAAGGAEATQFQYSQQDLRRVGVGTAEAQRVFVDTAIGLTQGVDDNLEGFYASTPGAAAATTSSAVTDSSQGAQPGSTAPADVTRLRDQLTNIRQMLDTSATPDLVAEADRLIAGLEAMGSGAEGVQIQDVIGFLDRMQTARPEGVPEGQAERVAGAAEGAGQAGSDREIGFGGDQVQPAAVASRVSDVAQAVTAATGTAADAETAAADSARQLAYGVESLFDQPRISDADAVLVRTRLGDVADLVASTGDSEMAGRLREAAAALLAHGVDQVPEQMGRAYALLGDVADRRPEVHSSSGNERERVASALALAGRNSERLNGLTSQLQGLPDGKYQQALAYISAIRDQLAEAGKGEHSQRLNDLGRRLFEATPDQRAAVWAEVRPMLHEVIGLADRARGH